MNVGIIVGSVRKGSFSQKIAEGIAKDFPKDWTVQYINIGDVPMYNQDLDDTPPKEWTRLREDVKNADAFLFVTPEYNRSVPPVLKNAIDVASRPYGQNQWGGKPGAIASVSPGRTGAYGANHTLRQSMVFLDVYTMQQPEMYLGGVTEFFDESGEIAPEKIGTLLQTFADGFVDWVNKFQKD